MRHEIVHNPHVFSRLAEKGAIFSDELNAVPDGVPVIFSAHGITKSVRAETEEVAVTSEDTHFNLPPFPKRAAPTVRQ